MTVSKAQIVLIGLIAFVVSTSRCTDIGDALSLGEATHDSISEDDGQMQIAASDLCLAETNAERRNNGKGAYIYDTKLENAAKNHNNVMTSQNCFSHQCSGEPSMGDRVTKTGYRWGGVAENIAAGQGNCKETLKSWMNSSGHRANILGNYKHVGCAYNECSSCQYRYYWTCVYASPL